MRIPKTFGQRDSLARTAAKKYYLIYEGAKTEAQYFDGIAQNKGILNINSLIEIVPILRSYNEKDWSNPKKILDKLIEYVDAKEGDSLAAGTFLDKVIDWLMEEQIISDRGIYTRKNLREKCLQLFGSEQTMVELAEASQTVSAFLTRQLNISDSVAQIEDYVKRQFVTYEDGYDKICLIADRDRQSFKEEQYDYVLRTCKEKGYDFYVSNPCFELFLLLHYDEVLAMDREKLLANPKEPPKAKKRFLQKQLSKLMDGYSKENLNFEKLVNRVNKAVENEKHFCENPEELKTQLGSNLGLLIKEMQ